jgi:hypothetical protein
MNERPKRQGSQLRHRSVNPYRLAYRPQPHGMHARGSARSLGKIGRRTESTEGVASAIGLLTHGGMHNESQERLERARFDAASLI